jgi:pimeloyl-ACP methyl ester carboxylesterase
VHYVDEGKGTHTLVFFHCWAGNLKFWREQVPALSERARLILIDLPGHGLSDAPHTNYTMDFFAQAVMAVMNDAGVSKATLIGHSMGVPIICSFYKQFPEHVAGLVAVDGTLRRPKMTPKQSEEFIARFSHPDYREKTRAFIGTMFPAPGTEEIRDDVIADLLETPQFVMVGAAEGMFGTKEPDWDPHHVDVPVVVINAPNSMWTDEYKEYVHSLSSETDYHLIEGVGHWLMLEKPSEFNAVLTGALAKYQLIDK